MNQTSALPLVVDLDGTLTPTDTLHESLIQLVKQSPLNLFRLPLALLKGKAVFKEEVAAQVDIDPVQLPYRQDVLDYIRSEKAKGRPIILATAAHASIAKNVANYLDLFDQVLATESDRNLKGAVKLQTIRAKVGEKFSYAGDSATDLPIWQAASSAILVGVEAKTADDVKRTTTIEHEFPKESVNLKVWLRALRVHQWLKNLLLFVPLLTAFLFHDVGKLITMCIAFLAFSFAASGTYILNDLWDLNNDRQHPRKRNRPFASALLPIHHGLAMSASILGLAFVMGILVSPAFVLILFLYVVLTTAYSWLLKTYVLIDVLMLSLLYTLRILAGSIAVAIPVSSWLFAFSVFIFLSLALVKRCAEMVSLKQANREIARGRDYRVSDLVILWPMGVGTALSAVVIFGLFISTPETQARYAKPQLLWLVAVGLIYWLGRLWVKTSRGEMHDDPVVYAIKDRGSRVVMIFMFAIMMLAHTVNWSGLP
ncbi:MAG: UbiA family prenyltransferase [Azonexus sp.]|jgi:4-hydroxybenzoate polyprenyltransferase/phosphoserine phosphatase|nr:UbiA family prenyltransferase [Azonexus sp.]